MFLDWLKSLFSEKKSPSKISAPVQEEIVKPILPPPVLQENKEIKTENEDVNWIDWAGKAAFISSTYEGKGGDYANITGNFDGAFLTCGLLGLTWKYGNQIKIMDRYLKKYGPNPILKMMPNCGQEYLQAVNSGESSGARIVADWSRGSHKVREPYKSELTSLYSSKEMVELQNEIYSEMMGKFAKKMSLEAARFFKIEKPLFEHYAFFWDQAVLNGQGNTVPFENAYDVGIDEVLEFVNIVQGHNTSSNRLNYSLWKELVQKADEKKLTMFKLAYLRCLKSRREFQGTTLMRRGTLALGKGYVNGSLREYDWA